MAQISVRNLVKKYKDSYALKEVSLEIADGELFCLLGPSGCGKTTLLRIVAGLTEPDSGAVILDGRDITSMPPHVRGVGLVFQNYALWPHMTVLENVCFGLEMQRVARSLRLAKARRALDKVQLNGLEERFPDQLSGGQQQRVAVARALALEPKLILFDEPLSNLDERLRREIRGELTALHRRLELTMVYVTHDQAEALSMADRIALMSRAQVVQVGNPKEVYFSPESFLAADFLGTANIVPAKVIAVHGEELLVESPLGMTSHRTSARYSAGQPLKLCVRPQFICLLESRRDNLHCVNAEFQGREFLGDYERLFFKVAGHPISTLNLFPTSPERPANDAVILGIDPAGIAPIVE